MKNGIVKGVSYTKNNVIRYIKYKNDKDQFVKKAYLFYPNGSIERISNIIDGKEAGPIYGFYPNGNFYYKMNLVNNMRIGEYVQFHEHINGAVKYRVNYSIVAEKEWENGFLKYDDNGKIIGGSDWLIISKNKKVYHLNDNVIFDISLIYPREKFIKATIGEYDKYFNNRKHVKSKVYTGVDHKVRINLKASKVGVNNCRGYVSDYKVLKPSFGPGDSLVLYEKQLFFDIKYIVN